MKRETPASRAGYHLTLVLLALSAFYSTHSAAQTTDKSATDDPVAILAAIEKPAPPRPRLHLERPFPRSEYTLQLTGLLTPSSSGPLTSKLAKDSLGFLFGMRFHLNRWEALEVEFGSTSDATRYISPKAPTNPTANVPSPAMRRLSLNEVVTMTAASHIAPFLLAGGGVAEFEPPYAQNSLSSQVRPVAVVGGGFDLRFLHLGIRAEVEGLFYRTPDFHGSTLSATWARVAQPSTGLVFSF